MSLTAVMVGIFSTTNIADTVRKNISCIVYYARIHNGVADNDNLSCHIPVIF